MSRYAASSRSKIAAQSPSFVREILIILLAAIVLGNLIALVSGDRLSLVSTAEASSSVTDISHEITNVSYRLSPANPTQIDGVSFDISTTGGEAPTEVSVELVSSSGRWFTCSSHNGGSTWECPVYGLSAQAVNTVNVQAGQ